MNSHARETLDILRELKEIFPDAYPCRLAESFRHTAETLAMIKLHGVNEREAVCRTRPYTVSDYIDGELLPRLDPGN